MNVHTRALTFEYRVDEGADATSGGHGHGGAQCGQRDHGPPFGAVPDDQRPSRAAAGSLSFRRGSHTGSHGVSFGVFRSPRRAWATETFPQNVPVRRTPRHSAALEKMDFSLVCKVETDGFGVASGTDVA